MLQEAKLINGKGGIMTGLGVTEQAARIKEGAEELKERAEEMFEDAVSGAKRLAKKTRYATEDLMEDTAHKIKKAPFLSVGVTFAAGVGLGLLTGLLVSRLSGACSDD